MVEDENGERTRTVLNPFWGIIEILLVGSGLLPLCIVACTRLMFKDSVFQPSFVLKVIAGVAVVLGIWWTVRRLRLRWSDRLDEWALRQADSLDTLSVRFVPWAIAASAGLSLFLELAMIRWQSTVFAFLSFYKNFALLSCFAGLGLGYALARRKRIPLFCAVPLVAWQVALLLFLRHGLGDIRLRSMMVSSLIEQSNMSFGTASGPVNFVPIYWFLAVVFGLTALAFVPIGQLCGRLMERRPNLSAYGLNLLGSLAGIGLMLAMSYVWAPPVAWFLVGLLGLAAFQWFNGRIMAVAALLSAIVFVALALPLPRGVERTYSPYQIVQYKTQPVLEIKAAGLYYQRAIDLSDVTMSQIENEYYSSMKRYYELPLLTHPGAKTVAVLGSGSGNDVAAALRRGAERVHAVDIDPVLIGLGRSYHPEKPYSDPRVHAEVNDARSFIRQTEHTFDVITYGFIDSYSLLSQSSSVRLDSFVYTVNGLREARQRLNEGGIICLAFAGLTPELDGKLYAMMTEAFDGHAPQCVRMPGFPSVAFLQRKDGGLELPAGLLGEGGFEEVTALCAENSQDIDKATDDWPFFYMPRRVYPVSYLGMLALTAILSIGLIGAFAGRGLQFNASAFFFLGAGFMLVETKGITELGLTFGNTWQVIGFVIAGVLLMAFLANLVVSRFGLTRVAPAFVLLLASLALGYGISVYGGFPSTGWGRVAAVAVLTCPLFFSGMVFSTLLRNAGGVAGAMAMNVLGSMCGGLLEYNSMYFGFRFLYVLAGVIYVLAYLSALRMGRGRTA